MERTESKGSLLFWLGDNTPPGIMNVALYICRTYHKRYVVC